MAAWGLNRGSGDPTMREKGRCELSIEEAEAKEAICGFGMREG